MNEIENGISKYIVVFIGLKKSFSRHEKAD